MVYILVIKSTMEDIYEKIWLSGFWWENSKKVI